MSALIYTVAALNQTVNTLLTDHFQMISVTGEISNLSRPSSGHVYFSLKDADAQIRCAYFRFQHQKNAADLENGQQVIVQAQVSVYEPRGDYQLIVKSVALHGLGALQLAFENLKNKLEKAGLFDHIHKKTLPLFPKKIGVITSSTGAALQDILKVHQKRFPAIPLLLYPVAVQGVDAKNQIVAAIEKANQDQLCDVILLARGGGSLEDLWAFNEEIVARAIYASTLPIVTGIGHQTDFTIADFVADVRAPTPSAAIEIITPDQAALITQLKQYQRRLEQCISTTVNQARIQLQHLEKRLQHPKAKLEQQAQQLDQLELQFHRSIKYFLETQQSRLASIVKTMNALSPLKVLERGYTITKQAESGKVLYSIQDIKPGDTIVTTLHDGSFTSSCI